MIILTHFNALSENFHWIYQKPEESRLKQFADDRKEILKLLSDRCRKSQADNNKAKANKSWLGEKAGDVPQTFLISDKLLSTSQFIVKPLMAETQTTSQKNPQVKPKKRMGRSNERGKDSATGDEHRQTRKRSRPSTVR